MNTIHPSSAAAAASELRLAQAQHPRYRDKWKWWTLEHSTRGLAPPPPPLRLYLNPLQSKNPISLEITFPASVDWYTWSTRKHDCVEQPGLDENACSVDWAGLLLAGNRCLVPKRRSPPQNSRTHTHNNLGYIRDVLHKTRGVISCALM